MKSSLLPFSFIAAIPAFVLLGLGAVPALGLITVMGTLAMLMRDYSSELSYQRKLTEIRHHHSLPLAA
ncbi:MAG: hypothetical protein SynsKO_35550 [Synoicihabitans sp.]